MIQVVQFDSKGYFFGRLLPTLFVKKEGRLGKFNLSLYFESFRTPIVGTTFDSYYQGDQCVCKPFEQLSLINYTRMSTVNNEINFYYSPCLLKLNNHTEDRSTCGVSVGYQSHRSHQIAKGCRRFVTQYGDTKRLDESFEHFKSSDNKVLFVTSIEPNLWT